MKTNKTVILISTIITFAIVSCKTSNQYQSPKIDSENLLRDTTVTDTTSIATFAWREFYSDPLLVALIDEALKKNVDLQIAESGIRQAEASLQQAGAAFFPNLALTGQLTDVTDMNFDSKIVLARLGVTATWEADIWGKLSSKKRAQKAIFLKSESYKTLIQSSLIANIATSYYSLLALDKKLQITNETVVLLEKNLETIIALKESAKQTAAAVEQSRSLLLATQLSTFDLQTQITQLENAICLLAGRKSSKIARSTLEEQILPKELKTGLPVAMLARRPDVAQAELDFRAAFELTQVARKSFYPSLTLSSGSFVGLSAAGTDNFFNLENLLANLIAGLTQPVFAQGQLKASLKIATENQMQAELHFKNAVLVAGREVSDILLQYQNSLAKTILRGQQIDATQKAAEFSQELLKQGEAIYTEVLSAHQNSLSAQLAATNDCLEQLQCAVNLYRALGGGANL